MKTIIQKVKTDLAVVIFGAFVLFCAAFGFVGCSAMYTENGELTPETQAAIQSTTQTAQAITAAVAPQATPLVPLGAAVVGSVLTVVGAICYNKKNKA